MDQGAAIRKSSRAPVATKKHDEAPRESFKTLTSAKALQRALRDNVDLEPYLPFVWEGGGRFRYTFQGVISPLHKSREAAALDAARAMGPLNVHLTEAEALALAAKEGLELDERDEDDDPLHAVCKWAGVRVNPHLAKARVASWLASTAHQAAL